jgi:uncharacterized protein HemY
MQIGKVLIFIGIVVLLLGVILYFFGDKLSFLGKLPGDIRIEKENFRFYFPITTMLIISVILSLLIGLFRKLF